MDIQTEPRTTAPGPGEHHDPTEPESYRLNAAKLLRLRDTLEALDTEAIEVQADPAAQVRINAETQRLLVEVGTVLPDPLLDELKALIGGIDGSSTDSEWRMVRGQLIGWIDGLFLGLQP